VNVSLATEALSPQTAVDALIARLAPVGTETIAASDAFGRVLGQRVLSDRPSPAADVSAMDGYALRHADLAHHRVLPVCGEVRIGREPILLPPEKVLRIVTGAGIPSGADTVIRREDTHEYPDRIVIRAEPACGDNIRRRGQNAAAGHEVVPLGTLITPPVAAALATFGCARPLVQRRVRLGVIVTGDEVQQVGADVTPWMLRDSNGPGVASIVANCGWIDGTAARHAIDEPDALRRAIRELLDTCDAVVLTGGVSMGTRDFVPSALRALGAEIVFHGVRQRPGKPLLGALGPEGQAIFGLPGNPLAVMVGARRVAVPVLGHLAGMRVPPSPLAITVDMADEAPVEVWSHRPIRLTAPGRGELVVTRGSGDVVAAATSDGFVEVPPNASALGPWPYYAWTA